MVFGPSGELGMHRSLIILELRWKVSAFSLLKVSPTIPPLRSDEWLPSLSILLLGRAGYHSVVFSRFDRPYIDALVRCDGAWDKASHKAVAAWVADICSSEFQVQDSLLFRASSALQVEAQACRLCLQWANMNGVSQVLVYTDSDSLVSAISSKNCAFRYLEHTISEIKLLAASLYGCCIMKVSREEVAVAHDLAKSARNPSFPFVAAHQV